jgi:hypothetical protein
MSDEQDTLDAPSAETPDATTPVAPEPAAVEPAPAAGVPESPTRDRLLIPLLLPLASIVAVVLYVLNVSRVFLASGKDISVVIAVIITVGILVGAALISASPRLRSSSLTMILAVFILLVLSAGLVTLGPSEQEKKGGGGFQQPKGPPVATLDVQALPSISFNAKQYGPLPAGIIQVNYSGAPNHTLAFTDPKLNGFELKLPGGPKTGKVDLKPGTHTIYCTVPGHRQQGMEATVTVTGGGGAAPATSAGPTSTTSK